MVQISGTVTVGNGSEIHNHDSQYRNTLKHVITPENDVIELMTYKDYKTQVNEIMRPYIEEYNERQEMKYKAAWEKFNAGKIKNKPKKKDYKPMGFDYYSDHKNDIMKIPRNGKTEVIPIFRSFIIGIGDQEDRQKIPQETAVRIFQNTLEQFKKDFPNFYGDGISELMKKRNKIVHRYPVIVEFPISDKLDSKAIKRFVKASKVGAEKIEKQALRRIDRSVVQQISLAYPTFIKKLADAGCKLENLPFRYKV